MKKIVIKDKYSGIEKIFEVLAEFVFKSSDSFDQIEFARYEKREDDTSKYIYSYLTEGVPTKLPCFSTLEMVKVIEEIFKVSYKNYDMTSIILWLKERVLDEEANKKVIGYKITRENKITKKNIIKLYEQEEDDEYDLLL
ncbi:hypothetical protein [Terrisporobacter mayombei]|uniref:Uncharacterized protein n=1 Tax=Terrisporobacter mayombei TaxID=1541 RepID=A0ABY9Q5Z0_9FIRM|nr:hypothetical protein [Terrisporobacter mayombei]MCC3868919.1 hypothetical protein [Terrisporobacter mayombei]WMT82948.1 hypothetical protein TEMA_34460 [Terrisporobacter mayombei]